MGRPKGSVAKKGLNPKLDRILTRLMDDTVNSETSTLEDKLKVLDRVLKWEAIKLKADDEDFGVGLFEGLDDGANINTDDESD
jgi:hypothetical protein